MFLYTNIVKQTNVCVSESKKMTEMDITTAETLAIFSPYLYPSTTISPIRFKTPEKMARNIISPLFYKERGKKVRRRSRGNEVRKGHCLCRRKLSLIKSKNNTGTQKDD